MLYCQPRLLAWSITLLPVLTVNTAYLISADAGFVPWCITYLDGCTSISRASRNGDALFLFRAAMIVQAAMLAWYWLLAGAWLNRLARRHPCDGHHGRVIGAMQWLGVIAALFLILYADYLGTTGEWYRFMRRYGVIFYFTFTPLAQMLMLSRLTLLAQAGAPLSPAVLRFKLTVLLLVLLTGIISLTLSYSGHSTFERENVLEWNFALLNTLFFAGTALLWRNVSLHLRLDRAGRHKSRPPAAD